MEGEREEKRKRERQGGKWTGDAEEAVDDRNVDGPGTSSSLESRRFWRYGQSWVLWRGKYSRLMVVVSYYL